MVISGFSLIGLLGRRSWLPARDGQGQFDLRLGLWVRRYSMPVQSILVRCFKLIELHSLTHYGRMLCSP